MAIPQISNLRTSDGGHFLALQTAAPSRKQPSRLPLEEKDNRRQDGNLSHHRAQEWLERLVHDTDSQRRVNRADEVADAPDDDRHEAIHDIALAKTRPDVAEL